MSGLEEAVRRVLGLPTLRRFDVAVVGGLAVSARTEPRFTRDIDLFEAVVVPVASVAALIALKLLARDDEHRPQDAIDLARLRAVAGPADLDEARTLVRLIEGRGYARGRGLVAALGSLTGRRTE